MKQGTPNVRTAAKDILARLLASEDLTVQHDASAETAYFDTQNRILCLPVWEDMDSHMYDMLVGHEVSHALHTPADGWQGFVGDDANSPLRHMCLNVCEDARIERKIKDKFPGLRRDFAKAYKSLHERDIFEMKGKSVSDLPLIDRINLYYKGEIYGQMNIPFTAEEREWLTRLDAANSFEDIMEVASDLFDATKEEQEQQQQQQQQVQQDENGEESAQGVGEGEGGSDSEKGETSESASGAVAGDEQGDNEQGEDSGQSADDDTDDGESADSQQGEQSSESGDDLSYDSYKNDPSPGSTQRNYEKAQDSMRDDNAKKHCYFNVPHANLDNIIISPTQIAAVWDEFLSSTRGDRDQHARYVQSCREFKSNSKAIVNHMVQQFQQKQAADASKRSHVAKTGVLDTTTMINYRWSEDIFLKNEVHSDGKNHGIVLFLDWSGSMSGILKDTIEQLLILVEFCRKAGIPYEVYAFTSCMFNDEFNHRCHSEEALKKREAYYANQFATDDNTLSPHGFQLLNFLSSKQNAKQHITAVNNLYNCGCNNYRVPSVLHLGSTPLNEAIVAGLEIVPQFQSENAIQIVNTIFLTDGDGHNILGNGYYQSSNKFIQDPVTRKTYAVGNSDTNALIQLLKDRTGASAISIRLHDSNNIKSLRYRYFSGSDWDTENAQFEKACKSYKTGHHFVHETGAWDLNLVVKGNLKVETDPFENLPGDASNTRIRNAFIKGGNRKKSSRVISNRIVDVIAVG